MLNGKKPATRRDHVLVAPPTPPTQGTLFVPEGDVPNGLTDALLPLTVNILIIDPKGERSALDQEGEDNEIR